jgi:hypothetical protein
MRAVDYHPMDERLLLADRQNIEISELEYETVPDQQAALSPAPLARAVEARKPDANGAEITARSVLHDLGADLGGEITVRTDADSGVEVSGFAGTPARRAELEAALNRIPGIRTRLTTTEDLQARNKDGPAAGLLPGTAPQPAAIGDFLSDRIPDTAEREAVVSKALDLTQALLSHTFALARLGERYPPDEENRLSGTSKATLGRIIADHNASLRAAAHDLGLQLTAMFGPPPPASAIAEGGLWQDRTREVLRAAQRIDAGLSNLLSQARDSKTAGTMRRELASDVALLEALAQ